MTPRPQLLWERKVPEHCEACEAVKPYLISLGNLEDSLFLWVRNPVKPTRQLGPSPSDLWLFFLLPLDVPMTSYPIPQ